MSASWLITCCLIKETLVAVLHGICASCSKQKKQLSGT